MLPMLRIHEMEYWIDSSAFQVFSEFYEGIDHLMVASILHLCHSDGITIIYINEVDVFIYSAILWGSVRIYMSKIYPPSLF